MPWFHRHRTGRPPHPDVLTPAEWRVLEHVREGRTNPEIASILGVSSNTVKTQVSSMLGKLALENRAQLAAWPGVPAEASRVAVGRFQLVGPLAWAWRHGSTVAAGAGAVGAVALFMFAMQGANGSGGTAVAPTEIATSSPTPVIEEPSPTPPVDQAVVAPPVQMDGTFTVVVYPNNASEAPPTHIERVNVSDGRVAAQEVVLDATRIVGPNAYINTWRNVTYPTRAVGNVIVAAICVDWQAQCGGMGSADPQARTTLVRSSDGGVTWDVLDTLDGPYWVWSWTPDGSEVFLWEHPTEHPAGPGYGSWEFVQWPGLTEVTAPSISGVTVEPQRPPIALGPDELAWWTADGLVDRQGSLVVDFADLGASPGELFEASISPDGRRLVLTWIVAGAEGQPWRWTLFERDTDGTFELQRTLEQPAELFPAVPYSWLDANRVLIPTNGPVLGLPSDLRVGYLPAVVDFQTGEVSAVQGFEAPDIASRGNLVIRVEPR